MKSIRGLQEPRAVSFISGFNKIYVANGKSGACDILDGSSFERIKSVKFADDADNIRYDAIGRRVYVGYAAAASKLSTRPTATIWVILNSMPIRNRSQLEKSGSRIFVNLPDSKNRGR